MTGRTIPSRTPCVWEGKETTIGAVQKRYAGTCYRSLVAYAIALGGATDHDGLVRYDLGESARRKKAGREAAKLGACQIQIMPKGR